MLKDKATAKSGTRKVGAIVAAAASVAGMVFAAAPATAATTAYPVSYFNLKYGESYYNGTATFTNRSVDVIGAFKASNSRRIYAQAWAGNTSLDFKSTSLWTNRAGEAHLPLSADRVGGSDVTWVYMTDENDKHLAEQTCYRGYTYCVDGLL